MNPIILNVATSRYLAFQDRFLNSLKRVGYTGPLKTWRDTLPPGSPRHEDNPYAFKLYAIDEAIKGGYDLILWCDSGVWFQKHPQPIFDEIKRMGNWFIWGGDLLGHWTSDFALDLFGFTRDQVFEKKWQLIGGTTLGFDLTNPTTLTFLKKWREYCDLGAFKGSYINNCVNLPEEVRLQKKDKPTGFVSSDPRCMGHRHDETIGSFLAYQLNMPLVHLGGLFQGPADSPNTVAKSGGL